MIAAIYARKSTEQNGVSDEAKSVTRQVEHSRYHTTRIASLLLLATLAFPAPIGAQQKDDAAYEQYRQGTSRVSTYFMALYDEIGAYVRHAQVLKKCGYKKEADETEARVTDLTTKRLQALVDTDLESRKLSSMVALLIAREGAHSMLVGYAAGYRESFTQISDLFPARTYEALCKASLQKVREWSGEAAK